MGWQPPGAAYPPVACAAICCNLPCHQVRTALNMLGPLLNPAHAAYGLVGVYDTSISELMAGSLLVGFLERVG